MTARRVVIVGGGISGLSCAFALREASRAAGRDVAITLLDAGPAGGHARTIQEDGFIVEGGPNGFLDREPETLALVKALGLESELVEARPEAKRRFIVRNGRLCQVPESPPALVRSDALSWPGKLRLIGELFAPGPPEGTDETVYDFARRRIGAEAAEMLVDAAVSGISAGDSRQLSVRSQFPIMIEMERDHGSLIRAMMARRKQKKAPAKLFSFTNGLATLIQKLTASLGDSVRTNTPVRAIDRRGAQWVVTTDRGESIPADHVVLAASARAAAPMVTDLDEALSQALQAIPYSSVNLIALAYRTSDIPRALDGYGYLVTRPEGLSTLGVVWESSLFPGRAPAGFALLRAFMGGARRPEVAQLNQADAIALARRELHRVLNISAEPARQWAFPWPSAIAQYNVGHADRLALIRSLVAAHPGLDICGTSYDGVSFNQAIVSGARLGRTIALSVNVEAAA